MTPTRHDAALRLSDHELETMLERAAEEGARRALNDVGLGGKDAVLTIHDMQSLGLMEQTQQAGKAGGFQMIRGGPV